MKLSMAWLLALAWVGQAQLPAEYHPKMQPPSAEAMAEAKKTAEARTADDVRKADESAFREFSHPDRVPNDPESLQRQPVGPHHRRHRLPAFHTNELGVLEPYIKQIVQLETGLNRKNESGNWEESSDEIEIEGDNAFARKTRHAARFASQLNRPRAIQVTGPDGKVLSFTPVGLIYYDPLSGQSAVIAKLRKSVHAVKVGHNTVAYPDCFEELAVEIQYRNSKSGLEQFVIVNERLPSPSIFGLNDLTARLQVATEFFDYPEPKKRVTRHEQFKDEQLRRQVPESEIKDENLDFGDLQITEGQIFGTDGPSSARAVYARKEFLKTPDGRTILFEVVPYDQVEPLFKDQPEPRRPKNEGAALPGRFHVPAVATEPAESTPIIAVVDYQPKGVVLDFPITVVSGASLTLMGNETYVVTGECNFTDLTIDAGTVVKYIAWTTGMGNSWIRVAGGVTCKTSPFRPAVFTSINDNSVGDLIINVPNVPNSTGTPVGFYGTHHLVLVGSQPSLLQNCRFRYGQESVWVQGGSATLRHCQFQDCASTHLASNAHTYLENCLITHSAYSFPAGPYVLSISESTSKVHTVHQCTIDNVGALSWVETQYNNPTPTIEWRNNILLRVTTANYYSNTAGDASYANTPSGFFGEIDTGEYYFHLAASNTNRGIANLPSNISAELLRDLRKRTTKAPSLLKGYCSSNNLVLAPLGIGDTNPTALDRGYHHPIVDFVANYYQFAGPATILLTNGVAVAVASVHGFQLDEHATFISEGRPDAPNRFFRQRSVFGFDGNNPLGSDASGLVASGYGVNAIWFRFTEFPVLAGASPTRRILKGSQYNPWSLSFRDCYLGGAILESIGQDAFAHDIRIHNNVFDRADLTLYPTAWSAVRVSARNNTFSRCTLTLINPNGASSSSGEFKDNIFDNVSFGSGINLSLINLSHNAYVYPQSAPNLGDSIKINLTSFTYAAGPLGNWYHGFTSLANQGQRNSIVAGLYHYTTRTDQAKEQGTTVDIGFHHAAAGRIQPIVTSVQGAAGWRFQYSSVLGGPPATDISTWESQYNRWANGSTPLPNLDYYSLVYYNGAMHPAETRDTAIVYQLPSTGPWYVFASVSDADSRLDQVPIADGVRVRASYDGVALTPWTTVSEAEVGVNYTASVFGVEGHSLAFVVNKGAVYNYWDSTSVNLSYYTDEPSETSGSADYLAEPTYTNGLPVQVTWNTPAHLQAYAASPANVVFDLTITNASAVKRVEYYVGSGIVGTQTSPPYAFSTSLTQGTYHLWTRVVGTNDSERTFVPRIVTVPAANSLPNVSWVNPVDGTVVSAGTTSVNLSITATDADGINRVEFHDLRNGGSVLIGNGVSGAGSAFNYNWVNLAAGTYPVKARAYDNAGNANEATITFSIAAPPVNQPPQVAWQTPVNGTKLIGPDNVLLTAEATDASAPGGQVVRVEFFRLEGSQWNLLGEGTRQVSNNVYNYGWAPGSVGLTPSASPYTVKARATTQNSATAESPAVSFTMVTPPTVQILQPSNGTVWSASQTKTARVQVNPTVDVSAVSLHLNGWGGPTTAMIPAGNGIYTVDLALPTPGKYVYYARATFNGAFVYSAPVAFEVGDPNLVLTVSLENPADGSRYLVGQSVTLAANAAATAVPLEVSFYDGAVELGRDSEAPFAVNAALKTPGVHRLVAVARAGGRSRISVSRTVTVEAAPPEFAPGFWETYHIASGEFNNDPETVKTSLQYSGTRLVRAARTTSSNSQLSGAAHKEEGQEWSRIGPTGTEQFISAWWLSDQHYIAAPGAGGALVWRNADNTPPWSAVANFRPNNTANYEWTMNGWHGGVLVAGSWSGTLAGATESNIKYLGFYDPNTHLLRAFGPGVTSANTLTSLNGPVRSVVVSGEVIYLGGEFSGRLLRSSDGGATWETLGAGINGAVHTILPWNDSIIVGGTFTGIAGVAGVVDHIAQWKGGTWLPLRQGVSGAPDSLEPVGVYALAGRGNHVYAGGRFDQAGNEASDVVISPNIAEVVWNSAETRWEWREMDRGVRMDEGDLPGSTRVNAIAVATSADPTTFDVVAGGKFKMAGGLSAKSIARWRVGAQASARPTVVLEQPTAPTHAVGSEILFRIRCLPMPGGICTINNPQVLIDGVPLTTPITPDPGNAGYWSIAWTPDSNQAGSHLVQARASQPVSVGGVCLPTVVWGESDKRVLVVTSGGIIAAPDEFSVVGQPTSVTLDVLANDFWQGTALTTSTLTPAWRITDVRRWGSSLSGGAKRGTLGNVEVGANGKTLRYTPFPGAAGVDIFNYLVSNGSQASEAAVTVSVRGIPKVSIVAPKDGSHFPNGTSTLLITGKAWDPEGKLGSLRLYVDGLYAPASFASVAATAGFSVTTPGLTAARWHDLAVEATDLDAAPLSSRAQITVWINKSQPTSPNNLVAQIKLAEFGSYSTVLNGAEDVSTYHAVQYPILREGQVSIKGDAKDLDASESKAYRLTLCRPNEWNIPLATLTRPTQAGLGENRNGWFEFGPGQTGITDGLLGTADFSIVPDGVYDLLLTLRGGDLAIQAPTRISIQCGLKLGRFTFSEQDALIPVIGLPLTLVRTYDSFNPLSGDLGYAWTFEVNDLDVRMDEVRENKTPFISLDGSDSLLADLPDVEVRAGGGHNVSLNLPGYGRTTFLFKPRLDVGNVLLRAEWRSAPGVFAKLSMTGNNGINAFLQGANVPNWNANPATPFERFDIPQFKLETADGTVMTIERSPNAASAPHYFIDEAISGTGLYKEVQPLSGRLRLTEIRQTSGDRITIDLNAIKHFPPGGQTPTRKIELVRDAVGRIAEVKDPDPAALATRPLIRYLYDESTGNLAQVQRLQNRSTADGVYALSQYYYENPKFPHYLTRMSDSRGVIIARNEYDETGKLIAMVNAEGRRTSFLHESGTFSNPAPAGAVVKETVLDHEGRSTQHYADVRGNVLQTVDPLDHYTDRQYDDKNNLKVEVLRPAAGLPGLIMTIDYEYQIASAQTYPEQVASRKVQLAGNLITKEVYNNRNQLVSRIAPRFYQGDGSPALETHYGYDGVGRPTEVRFVGVGMPANAVVFNDYASATIPGYLNYTLDALNNRTDYAYVSSTPNRRGDLESVTQKSPSGEVLSRATYLHDESGNRRQESRQKRDANGQWQPYATTSFDFDAQNRLAQSTDPAGGISKTEYNLSGRVKKTTDRHGAITCYFYDAMGRLAETQHPDASIVRIHTGYAVFQSEPKAVRFTATEDRHFVGEIAGGSLVIHDELGRPVKTQRWNSLSVGLTLSGEVATTTFSPPAGSYFSETETRYDFAGRIDLSRDANGRWMKYEYDDAGQRWKTRAYVSVSGSVAADIAGVTVTTLSGYDKHRNQVWTLDADQYEAIKGKSYTVTINGVVTTKTLSVMTGAEAVAALYPLVGNPPQLASPNEANRLTRYTYDNLDRQIRVDYPTVQAVLSGGLDASAAYREMKYDDLGRRWLEIDPDGHATASIFDAMGRLVWVVTDVFTAPAPPTALPSPLPATRAAWTVWARGSRSASDSTATQYGYDDMGNLATQTDASGRITTLAYDSLNRRIQRTLPSSTADYEQWIYDYGSVPGQAKLNRVRHRDFNKRFTLTTQDLLGRVVERKPDGLDAGAAGPLASAGLHPVNYTYTSAGQRASMSDAAGVARYAYDEQNRLRIKQSGAGTLYYEYDAAGNVRVVSARRGYAFASNSNYRFGAGALSAGETRPAGVYLGYEYNSRDRLWKVTDAPGTTTPAATYNYGAAGSVVGVTYRNGVATGLEYNGRHQLRRSRAVLGTQVANFDYDEAGEAATVSIARGTWGASLLSGSGRRNRLTERVGSGAARTVNYVYDRLNRLAQEAVGATTVSYDSAAGYGDTAGFDAVSNRRGRNSTLSGVLGRTYSAYDGNDRLSATPAAGLVTAASDANGNTLTADLDANGTADWSSADGYDFENHLIAANRNGATIALVYDGDGQRVRKGVTPPGGTGTTTTYLVDDRNATGYAQVLEEINATGGAAYPASGLVGKWLLDEASGTTAADSSGGGHHGTLGGASPPSWIAGHSGNGLQFGWSRFVSVPDSAALRLGTGMTIAFWVRKDMEAYGSTSVVGKGTQNGCNYVVWLVSGSPGGIKFQFKTTSGVSQEVNSTVGIPTGQWQHVACTYDGTMGRIYVNGVAAGVRAMSGTPITDASSLKLGYPGYYEHLYGTLDEVLIYKRALSAAEIGPVVSPSGGSSVATYLYGLDLIAQNRSGTMFYYGYDGLGSVRYLTSGTGVVTDTYTYDAYGILIGPTGAQTPNNYRYTGEQWDPDLGMYYLRARYYHPDLGRFWTMDSYEGNSSDPMSLHKYLYVHDNPVNGIDPSGHEFTLSGLSSAAGIGNSLQSIYNGVLSGTGTSLQATIFGVQAGKGINEIVIDFILDETGLGLAVSGYNSLRGYFQSAEEAEAVAYQLWEEELIATAVIAMGDDYGEITLELVPQCFVAGTPVATQTGLKPIELVQPGDLVWAWNDVTAEPTLRAVQQRFVHQRSEIFEIKIGRDVLEVTGEHPFFDPIRGWVRAQDLEVGETLVTASQGSIAVETLNRRTGDFTVYNFEVEIDHNYYVGEEAILTHNANALRTAMNLKSPLLAAHHIVALTAGGAEAARRLLLAAGTGITDLNSALNGIALPKHFKIRPPPGYANSAVHSVIHTTKYYQEIERRLRSVAPNARIQVLRTASYELRIGKFRYY